MINRNLVFVLCTLVLSLSAGCSNKKADQKPVVIAMVNSEQITSDELKKDMAAKLRYNPGLKVTPELEKEQLDSMIDKKLIIQEAMKVGLATEQKFIDTIKSLWEQTLIRDFVEFKKNEFKNFLFVTDEDVEKYLARLSSKKSFLFFKTYSKAEAEKALKTFTQNGGTSKWEPLGPVSYDEVLSDVILEAFDLGEGEAKLYASGPEYYVITVTAIEPVDVEFMRGMRPELEKRILAEKEKNFLRTG